MRALETRDLITQRHKGGFGVFASSLVAFLTMLLNSYIRLPRQTGRLPAGCR